MQPSVHIAKIIPPQVPQILPRPRLINSLQQQEDKKLILILGQAAQGKSTLAVSYVNASPVPSAWVNLGPEDTDAVTLFYLLGHALQRILPKADFSAALSYPAVAMGPREEGPLYRNWLEALLDRVPGRVNIILDGLDRLSPGASAFRLLQALLAVLPSKCRLFILSREMPPVDIRNLAEHQEVFRLNNADLAFNLSETTKYFHTIRNFHLSAGLIQRIHSLTEGWIGGLVLFCDSLDWVPESQRERYVSQELAGKFIWNIFHYFGERIFSLVPREVQEFLIKTSILEVVEPDFVKDAMGLDSPEAILEELVKRNLFVQPIYDKKKGFSYRYHPLFKEFLQGKFQTLMAREHQADSYYNAASLSERREDLEAAVRYYLKAQAYPEAAQAIERAGLELVRLGKTSELAQWLAALPADLVRRKPWLLFYHYMTGRFQGSEEHLASLQEAYALFAEQAQTQGLLLCLAYFLETSFSRGRQAIPSVHTLLAQAEALVESPAARAFPLEQAILWCQIGFAHFLRTGNSRKGVWACQNAYLLARDLGIIPLQFSALAYSLGCLAFLGEFQRAEEVISEAQKLWDKCPHPELRAVYYVNLCNYLWLKEDFAAAAAALGQAQEAATQHGLTHLQHVVLLYDLVLKIYQGDFRAAEEVGIGLAGLLFSAGNMVMYGSAMFHLGLGYYRRADYRKAREHCARAAEILSSHEGQSDFYLFMVKIISSLAALHLGEDAEVEQGLAEAHAHFQDIESHIFLKESHLALALWKWRQGDTARARDHLEAGLKIAQDRDFYLNLLLNRKDMLRVCTLALELEAAAVWDYASRCLSRCLPDLADAELARLARHHNREIADKAWEIRKTIHRANLPRLRFQTLGGFRFWRGEVLVDDKEWEGHQPQLLLKAIIGRGSKGVPKDVLMEDLWPEAPPDLTEKNFKVNLHRLRKVLEPVMNKTYGSSYVHLKANLISLDPELCHLDIDDFLSALREAEREEEQGNAKQAVSLYQRAAELYGGPFLAEELYHSWAEAKREELQGKYLELLHRLAKLYEARGSVLKAIDCWKQVIQTDPLAEGASRNLMLLYAKRGMRNAALRVYEECRQALQEMLNAEPEEATTAIYRKIQESAAKSKPAGPGA
ncbi:MAG: BTAD domain-containing putative transcriptional regulator [Deltaproteobacteria bacterium]|nr:BTAD domain-containing putative transcriptional regulator [Deltaproteobacteria bacterium]